MRRPCIVAWLAVLAMAPGCPHAFGRGGTIDEALLKDAIQEASERGCPEAALKADCGAEFFDDCMAECQQRLRSKEHR